MINKWLKTRMRRVLIASALMLLSCPFAQANTVSFNVVNNTVDLASGNFIVDIVGSGFVNSTDGGAISIDFDFNVLNAISVSVDTATWEFFDAPGVIDNNAGTITGIEFATFATPADSFTIASILFAPIADGVSALSISEFTTGVLGGFGLSGSPQAVTFGTNSITVTTVPLPAAFWFFISGIMGLFMRIPKKYS